MSDADPKFLLLAEADNIAEADKDAEAFFFIDPLAETEPLQDAEAEASLLTFELTEIAPSADRLAAPDIACPGSVPAADKVADAVIEAEASLLTLVEEETAAVAL